MGSFEPKLDILPAPQRRLWDELSATPSGFVLYGGTAIALRLGHRHSDDFDFFSNDVFAPDRLLDQVRYLKGSTVRQKLPHTLTCSIDRGGRVLVSLFGGLKMNRTADPEMAAGGIRVASLLDLAATKVNVIAGRASLKDYLDLDALLRHGIDLAQAFGAGRAVFGEQFIPLPSLKGFYFFDDGDVSQLGAAARKRLSEAADKVDCDRLPVVESRPGIV